MDNSMDMEKTITEENKMVFGLKPELPYAIEEAINRLRINISFLGNDIRKIMIVSSEPNEGKSFVAVNLWSQIARAGGKTLLIDADMRNSTFCSKYMMSREDGAEMKGTSHYLSGECSLDEALLHTEYPDGKNTDMYLSMPRRWALSQTLRGSAIFVTARSSAFEEALRRKQR